MDEVKRFSILYDMMDKCRIENSIAQGEEIPLSVQDVLFALKMKSYEELDEWIRQQVVFSGFIYAGELIITDWYLHLDKL